MLSRALKTPAPMKRASLSVVSLTAQLSEGFLPFLCLVRCRGRHVAVRLSPVYLAGLERNCVASVTAVPSSLPTSFLRRRAETLGLFDPTGAPFARDESVPVPPLPPRHKDS